MAGIVRSRATTSWRARTGAWRSGRRGCLRDTASPVAWCACDGYRVRTQPAFVSQLGAEQVIDYRAVRFEDNVRDMDVYLTLSAVTLCNDPGAYSSLAEEWSPSPRIARQRLTSRVKQAFFIVEPNHKQLTRIGELLEVGDLQPVVDAVLPLTQASAAYSGAVKQRRGCGKLVVAVAPAEDGR